MFLIWCHYGQGDKAHVRLPNTSTFIFKRHFHTKEVTVSCTFLCNHFLEDMPAWSSTPSVQNLAKKPKAAKTLEQPGVLFSSQPPTAGGGCTAVYPERELCGALCFTLLKDLLSLEAQNSLHISLCTRVGSDQVFCFGQTSWHECWYRV